MGYSYKTTLSVQNDVSLTYAGRNVAILLLPVPESPPPFLNSHTVPFLHFSLLVMTECCRNKRLSETGKGKKRTNKSLPSEFRKSY